MVLKIHRFLNKTKLTMFGPRSAFIFFTQKRPFKIQIVVWCHFWWVVAIANGSDMNTQNTNVTKLYYLLKWNESNLDPRNYYTEIYMDKSYKINVKMLKFQNITAQYEKKIFPISILALDSWAALLNFLSKNYFQSS